MMRWLVRRELALVFGARVTWLVAAISAVLIGHGFVLALDIYGAASRSASEHHLLQQAIDPLSGLVRPTLGGLYLATAILLPMIAARGLAIEKERGSYGALALRAGSTHAVAIAKLIAALAGATLLLVPPVVLLVAFTACGGHLDPLETATGLLGHALDLTLIATTSVAAAAATRTVAQASVLAVALSLGSWAIDASGEFAALAWMGSLEWASIGRRLDPLERGILHFGSLGWLLVASASAATVAIVVARIERGARRWWIAGSIGVAAALLLTVLGNVHRGYDASEHGRQSFPLPIVAALRELPGDLAVDVWLDRDDTRRTEIERGPLAKLLLARPDVMLRMPLDTGNGALASREADYGRVVVHVREQARETRSSSDEEIVGAVFDAAGRAMPRWAEPSYPGYPFVAEGAARTALVVLAYLIVPLALIAIGLFVTRSRRRS